jgi:hypothetical protein
VASVLLRDHYRRGAAFGEALVVGLVLGIFLDPRRRPYEPTYVATMLSLSACVIPALGAMVLAARSGETRGEVFLLAGGRRAYFLAVLLAALASGLVWLSVMAAAAPLLTGIWPPPPEWLARAAGAVLLNACLGAAVSCSFSVLTGTQLNLGVAAALLILGLNASWFRELSPRELAYLEYLVPPLLRNVRAAAGQGALAWGPSACYTLFMVCLGALRFGRREFYWS